MLILSTKEQLHSSVKKTVYMSRSLKLAFYIWKNSQWEKRTVLQKTMRKKNYSSWVTSVTVYMCVCVLGFPGGSMVKNLPASAGDTRDMGSVPGSGRTPGGGHCNPLQYPCLENPMNRWMWWAAVHWVTKSWMWLKRLSMHAHVFVTVWSSYS